MSVFPKDPRQKPFSLSIGQHSKRQLLNLFTVAKLQNYHVLLPPRCSRYSHCIDIKKKLQSLVRMSGLCVHFVSILTIRYIL